MFTDKKSKLKVLTEKNYYMIIIGFTFGVFYWISDSFLDALFSGNTFIEELFHPSPHEAFTRSFVALLFVLFSAYAISIINDRKCLEEAIRRSKEFTETILISMTDAISIIDVNDFRIIETNQAFSDLYGLKKEDCIGKHCYYISHNRTEPCASPDETCPLQEVLRTGKNSIVEHIHYLKDGKKKYVEVSASPITNENGEITSMVHVARDITERRRAEDRIWLQSQMIEIMAEGINLVRASDGIIVYANPRFEQMFGYEPGDMIGIHVSVINAPAEKSPEDVAAEIIKVLTEKGEWKGEIFNIKKDGTKFWCSVNIKAFQHPEHGKVWISVHSDINEHKRAEERLSKLNECFLSFGTDPLENINRLVSLCGELMGATVALYNRLDRGMLCSWGQWNTPPGYNPVDKPQGHICYDTINKGSDEVLVVRNLAQTEYARTDPNVMAYNLKTYLGRPVRLGNDYVGSLCAVYQHDYLPDEDDKKLMSLVASAIAIEEKRRQSEKLLMESELRFRSIVQSANDAIIVADSKGRLVQWNKGAQAIFGYTEEEMIGKPASFMIPEKYRKNVLHIMSTGKSDFFEKTIESAGYRKDGREFPLEISIATWNIEKEAYYSVIIRDITERKLAEEELRSKQYLLSEAQRIAHIGSWDTNIVTGKITWSDEMYNIFGVPHTFELTRESFEKLIHPDDQAAMLRWVFAAISGEKEPELDFRTILPDGTVRFIRSSGEVIFDDKGKPIRMTGTGQDITERKLNEKKLREASLYTRSLIEVNLDPLVTINLEGEITDVNKATEFVTGFPREKLMGSDFSGYVTEPDKAREGFHLTLLQGFVKDFPLSIRHTSGKVTDVLFNASVYKNEAGEVQGVFAAARDITERKLADEQIKKSLREKEILLREIHHRVKNNMQIISSLLTLQAGYIEDRNYLEMFKDSQNRISTMALVHEKLYRSNDFTKINSNDYIVSIVNSIYQSYGDRVSNISMNFKIEDIELGIDSSIPFGLIINELVTNSLKHAFPDGRQGEIKIVLSKIDGNKYELIVSDNGIGFPEYLDFRKTKTLGLHLVSILAEDQLSGTIDLDRSNGTEFKIRFGEEK